MGRTIKNRNVSHPKPVQKIKLSENHVQWRGIVLILLLVIASIAFLYALTSYLKEDSGWTEIKVKGGAEANCSDDFTFQYNLGSGSLSPTEEYKAVTALYTEAAVKAYQLFTKDQSFDGVTNVYEINHHPNEVLTVDTVLYDAFAQLKEAGNRSLYLAPVYLHYENLFRCEDDSETMAYDPYQNEEVREEFSTIAAFVGDPQEIDLQLLGNNQVCLKVSDRYLTWINEMGYEDFLDFFWMKNAFLVDYMADTMVENGYTSGSISSYDGFIRNLDESGTSYSFNLYDREGQHIYPAATMEYTGDRSIVYLRDYRMNSQDSQHYYELKNGEIRTSYVDTKDGFAKNSIHNLVSYSEEKGCAGVLLSMIPIYISDSFSEQELLSLATDGIYSIYCKDDVIYYNDASLTLKDFYRKEEVSYTSSLRKN